MPLTLIRRAGNDTLGKLEKAARQRFREAERLLVQGESLAAVYLYGYSIEISLKLAYYRTIGLVPDSPIEKHHRKFAEDTIAAMPLLPKHPVIGGPSPGHHIIGWARLLEQTRAVPPNTPMQPAMANQMRALADNVFLCWAEFLRYRANRPYDVEIACVQKAAKWFRLNAGRLWR